MAMSKVYFGYNTNQQDLDAAQAQANIEASAKHGVVQFDPSINLASKKSVLIIGGGPTLNDQLPGGGTRLAEFDGRTDFEKELKIFAGSAHNLLVQEKVKNGGYACVMNSVDPDDEVTKDFYAVQIPTPGMLYLLSSYNGAAAYHQFPKERNLMLRYHAQAPGIVNPDNEPVIGAGSTAVTAALAIFMAAEYKNFEFYGVDGAKLETVPEGERLSQIFKGRAARYVPMSDRYQVYDMPAALQQPPAGNKLVVYVGDGQRAVIPWGQWCQLQEVANLLRHDGAGVKLKVHGDSLTSAVLNKGLSATLVHDPKGRVAPGTVIEGLFASTGGAAPKLDGPGDDYLLV